MRLNPHTGRGRPTDPGGDAGKGQLIQVATRCGTLDEFVEKFAAYAWEGSLVLPAATALPVGTQGKFVILLRDQTIAMRGRCRVTEAKQAPVSSRNPAVKRIMMRVALLEMDEQSRAVHRRLVALRSAPVPLPIPSEPSETTQIEPAKHGTAPGVAAAPSVSASSVPAPPMAAPPPGPPMNRTMIGVGLGPDPRALLSKTAPAGGPPSQQRPASDLDVTATGSQDITAPGPEARQRVNTLAHGEVRAPGSPYTLPANPLSEFDASDVDSFIECTLLESEEEMGTGIADQPPPQGDPTTVDSVKTHVRRETAHVRAGSVAAILPPSVSRLAPYAAVLAAVLIAGIVIGKRMSGSSHPVVASVAPAPAPLKARVEEPQIKAVKAKIETPAPAAAIPPRVGPPPAAKPAKPQAPAPSIDLGTLGGSPNPPAMGRGEHSSPAPHAIADLGAPEKPAVAQKPAAAEKPAASAKPTPPPKSAAVEAPAAPEKDEADDAPAAPKLAAAEKRAPAERPSAAPAAAPEVISGERGACMARVITEPKDAKVIWAGTEIGRSPIDTAKVPCGPAKVTVERERWQPVTVDVTLRDGDTAVVRQRLHRPRGLLVISSSPPGAQITVNRVAAGAAPKQVDIQRFEKVPIKITLKGYKPWSKTIYLKEAEAKIDAQLVAR